MRKKLIVFIKINILLFLLFTFQWIHVAAIDESSLDNEEKIYSNATLDDEFADDTVLVVLNKEVSLSEKIYDINDFIDFDCIKVTELNEETKKVATKQKENELVNTNYFRSILCLKLQNKSKQNVLNVINELIKRDDIIYAGPDYMMHIDSINPNDTYYSDQWSINSIDLNDAWDFVTGSSSVLVGVMDTGIDATHPDLNGKVNTSLSRSFLNGSAEIQPVTDPNGHGTHVAGIIGANTNNTTGIAGINWAASLVSLRIFDEYGNGYSSSAVLAINYAETNNIDLLNLSGGWYHGNPYYDEPMNIAISGFSGLLVCSAGNENNNLDNCLRYPAIYANPNYSSINNVITVGAIDQNNNKCSFSNYGEESVSIYAPGNHILSTFSSFINTDDDYQFEDGTYLCELNVEYIEALINYKNDFGYEWSYIDENFSSIIHTLYSTLNNKNPHDLIVTNHEDIGYHYMSGTSMSTPHVTGVAALLLSINPSLTISQIKNCILEGSDEITISIGETTNQNVLKLNADKAIKYCLENYSNSFYTLDNTDFAYHDSKQIVSGYSYFTNKNCFYKLNVEDSKNYTFNITSTNNLHVDLYDSIFNKLTYTSSALTDGISITQNLSQGTYYLRIYLDLNQSDTINVEITGTHNHDYSSNYTWINYLRHNSTCSICGSIHSSRHITSGVPVSPGSIYSECLLCGGLAVTAINSPLDTTDVTISSYITDQGSYKLSNGVIVLVENDLYDFLNGNLMVDEYPIEVEKHYYRASMYDDIADDSIVLALTKEASFRKLEYSIYDFSEYNVSSIIFLNDEVRRVALGEKENKLVNLDHIDDYRLLIRLKLNVKSKANVVDVIHSLMLRDDVQSAHPDYIMQIDCIGLPTKYGKINLKKPDFENINYDIKKEEVFENTNIIDNNISIDTNLSNVEVCNYFNPAIIFTKINSTTISYHNEVTNNQNLNNNDNILPLSLLENDEEEQEQLNNEANKKLTI